MKKTALSAVEIPNRPPSKRGKVRDIFDLGDRLLLVATDRISAFDCILPTPVPDKGRILTALSRFWFERTQSLVPNHLLSTDTADFPEPFRNHPESLRGRSMLVRRTDPLPVECVVRGYLAGSGWKEYLASGSVCGVPLPAGLRESDRLPEPIFTPTTKAEEGHDAPISFEETAARIGRSLAERIRDLSIRIYRTSAEYALERGILIADTKFEFGIDGGELVLIDEVLTPDSSRFWPADEYRPGGPQPSMDKQFVRDYLEGLDWDKTPPAPALPPEIVEKTAERYREAWRRLTGLPLP